MTVTAATGAVGGTAIRNALLVAELEERIQGQIDNPRRAKLEKLFGPKTDDEIGDQESAIWLRETSFWCHSCNHIFVEGDIVYRKQWMVGHGSAFGPTHNLKPFCEECVRGWHPSWWEARREPVSCAGECGVLVTWPYWRPVKTCSTRCTEIARKLRRRRSKEIACEQCGERFMQARSDARYCSDACRQKAYRRRQS